MTLHGMGKTDRDYASQLFQDLREKLGNDQGDVTLKSVFYDGDIQEREDAVFGEMLATVDLNWKGLREFVMYSLADAVAIEARRSSERSPYYKAQFEIAKTLLDSQQSLESSSSPVIILAHSLGCQVISNYIWDASQPTEKAAGIWSDPVALQQRLGASDDQMEFIRLKSLERLMTFGCNIPVFVAALAEKDIVPINKPTVSFRWLNFYDKDDVLGFPLRTLSAGYQDLVEDFQVNVGPFPQSLTPFAHMHYWEDRKVQESIYKQIVDIAG